MNFTNFKKRTVAFASALAVSLGAFNVLSDAGRKAVINAADNVSMEWGTLKIGGGGFVSGIVTGQKAMYARTDVGGAYRYDYDKEEWVQLFDFITEEDRGLLSVDAMAIDPTDDNTVYFLCGCAYFSAEKTVIFKTTDGGETFEEFDVTDMIQVHGNGNGRQTGESIAVDPDNPDTIYCGGDVYAGDSCLIKSTDGGKTWNTVKGYGELGLYPEEIKWPTWGSNMRHALDNGEYYTQNGISTICIYDGKVYVGTSTKGKYNVVVADVKDDKFTDMSADLDSKNIPGRITSDGRGNIFFAFQGGVQVGTGGTSGSIMKLDTKTGKITDISPLKNLYRTQTEEFAAPSEGGYSGVSVDPNNPDHMVSSTCGLFANAQLWEPWTDEHGPCWGDKFFKTEDGGEHWIEISPGITPFWGQPPIADYLDDGGYDWIRDKAIHWVGAYVIDPVNPDRSLSTSGNGVFACDNTWADLPQFHFEPDGIEEVVSLDFVSVPGGSNYSAIGDYDGFIHDDVSSIPPQYVPNMGSTSAIAYCPSNPDVMARTANGDGNNTGTGFYSLDAGKTWTAFDPACPGGKLSITEPEKGTYRIINSSTGGAVSYTDDFGKTWKKSEGINANKGVYTLVDLNNPKYVYASGAQHNDYWSSDASKKEPTIEESHYSFFVSDDYGATFKETRISMYGWEATWLYTHTCDLAYLSEGTVAMATDKYGVYIISDYGKTVTHLDNVEYAKCIGYGAPEKAGNPNTLYIYGRPGADDTEGIYRSTDSGKSWACINTDHLYGGTGNGNYLVGDMNEFGTVYMSTVGCGIVYGRLSDGKPDTPPTTKPPVTTTKPAETTAKPAETTVKSSETTSENPVEFMYGDINTDGKIDVTDLSCLSLYLIGDMKLEGQGLKAADTDGDGKVLMADLANLRMYLSKLKDYLGPKK